MESIKKLFLKNIFLFSISLIIILNFYPSMAKSIIQINSAIKMEEEISFKYCQSIDKLLFQGLENELILKYEYFFSNIPKDAPIDANKFIESFTSQVYSICNYKLTEADKKEFKNYFEKFYLEKTKY